MSPLLQTKSRIAPIIIDFTSSTPNTLVNWMIKHIYKHENNHEPKAERDIYHFSDAITTLKFYYL